MILRLALPPGRFENTGAGLEPKKSRLRRDGKPFRRDPAAIPDMGIPTQKGEAT